MAETLTNERFHVVKLYDPPIWINELKEYTITQGATNSTYQKYTPSNVNNSQLSWSIVTPSPDLVMDRHMYIAYEAFLYDTNPQAAGGAGGVFQGRFDDQLEGPRSYPLHSASTSVSASINGTTYSWTPDRVLSAMMHYYKLEKAQAETMCAALPDQRAAYQFTDRSAPPAADKGLLRNQFARPCDAFNMWNSTTRNINNFGHTVVEPISGPGAADLAPLNIQFSQVEPVILPPFEFGIHSQEPGLYGVSTLTLTYNFDYNRLWSSGVFDSTAAGLVPRVMTPGSLVSQTAGGVRTSELFRSPPTLFVKFYTLPASFHRPLKVSYPFYEINVYTDSGNNSIAGQFNGLAGVVTTFESPTMLVSSIPHRIYLFGKRAISATSGVANSFAFNSPAYPEVFAIIQSVNATINNQTGVLSSADCAQLYQLSVKNGLEDISWPAFTYGSYKGPQSFIFNTQNSLTAPTDPADPNVQNYLRQGPGSVVCLTAADLSLDEEYVSGSLGKFSLQFKCQMISPLTYSDKWNLYTVVVTEGITSYDSNVGTWTKEVGVVSSQEVLGADVGEPSMLKSSQNFYGGSMYSSAKNFGHKVLSNINRAAKYSREAILPALERGLASAERYSEPRRYGAGRIRSRSRPRGSGRLSRRDLL